MPRFDLNLLPIIVAIAKEKSVSRAARVLGMSQPAVSAALNKLRLHFNDKLFVNTSNSMEPTPRALRLIISAQEVMTRIEDDVLHERQFDPATSTDTFVFALSDIGEMVFLSKLHERLSKVAPLSSISSVTLPAADVSAALESGKVDLALGYFPDLQSNNFYQQRLFSHSFTCLVRKGHKIKGDQLTLEQFLSLGHASIKAEGRSQEIFERFLESQNLQRKIVISMPHFMAVPFIIATSDLVVTVPLEVGTSFASFADIKLMKPPFDIPAFDLKQHWHRKYHQDPKNMWLRNLIVELFGRHNNPL